MIRRPPRSPLFPSPTLSRSSPDSLCPAHAPGLGALSAPTSIWPPSFEPPTNQKPPPGLGKTQRPPPPQRLAPSSDRKSTRLNSSHSQISYAVFCLKKKKKHK